MWEKESINKPTSKHRNKEGICEIICLECVHLWERNLANKNIWRKQTEGSRNVDVEENDENILDGKKIK